jgi:hypothetical protein
MGGVIEFPRIAWEADDDPPRSHSEVGPKGRGVDRKRSRISSGQPRDRNTSGPNPKNTSGKRRRGRAEPIGFYGRWASSGVQANHRRGTDMSGDGRVGAADRVPSKGETNRPASTLHLFLSRRITASSKEDSASVGR